MLAKQPRVHAGARPATAKGARVVALLRPPSSSLRRPLVARAAKLDEVPLFASGDSALSGPPASTSGAGAAAAPKTAAEKIGAVPLNSEVRPVRRRLSVPPVARRAPPPTRARRGRRCVHAR